jgi:uncharacterized protein YrrD
MIIGKNATVFTMDEEKVGRIDRVVIDPRTREVTHVVVRQGFLFTEDKVLPISLVASAEDDRVVLREDAQNLEALPRFETVHYVPLDEAELGRIGPLVAGPDPLYGYPPYGVPYGSLPVVSPVLVPETERHVPEGEVALREGADVISADGEHVGDVEQVLTDPQADRATHFVISQGLLLKQKKLIPTTWVSRFGEESVHLGVGEKLIDSLPEYAD